MSEENGSVVLDEYGFEVYGEKTEARPCHNQDIPKSNKPTRYDEDGLGLLPFDD